MTDKVLGKGRNPLQEKDESDVMATNGQPSKRTILSAKRKKPENVRLCLPLFMDDADALLARGVLDVEVPLLLNGNCLYGDDAKKDGLSDAYEYAKKHGKSVRLLDINVALKGHVQGSVRLSEEDLLSGKYGMLRLAKYSTKKDLSNVITSIIEAQAKKLYPNVRKSGIYEWLQLDPTLARVLFEHYPISVVIVNSRVPYSSRIFSVAVIKPQGWKGKISVSLMHLSRVKVRLVG